LPGFGADGRKELMAATVRKKITPVPPERLLAEIGQLVAGKRLLVRSASRPPFRFRTLAEGAANETWQRVAC
jgi:hypothetical protein